MQYSLDIYISFYYISMYSTQENVSVTVESIYYSTLIRACTGFDRDLEDGEAIRRLMR